MDISLGLWPDIRLMMSLNFKMMLILNKKLKHRRTQKGTKSSFLRTKFPYLSSTDLHVELQQACFTKNEGVRNRIKNPFKAWNFIQKNILSSQIYCYDRSLLLELLQKVLKSILEVLLKPSFLNRNWFVTKSLIFVK